MATKTIDSFAALHEAVQEYNDNTMIYRGVKDISYELVPKAGSVYKIQRYFY